MQSVVIIIGGLFIVSTATATAGAYMLAGIGAACLVVSAFTLGAALLLRQGMITNG